MIATPWQVGQNNVVLVVLAAAMMSLDFLFVVAGVCGGLCVQNSVCLSVVDSHSRGIIHVTKNEQKNHPRRRTETSTTMSAISVKFAASGHVTTNHYCHRRIDNNNNYSPGSLFHYLGRSNNKNVVLLSLDFVIITRWWCHRQQCQQQQQRSCSGSA